MATKFDIKKSLTDATPLYAAVGAADTVYTTVRDRALTAYSDADARMQSLRAELKPSAVQAKSQTYLIDDDGSGHFAPTSMPRAVRRRSSGIWAKTASSWVSSVRA